MHPARLSETGRRRLETAVVWGLVGLWAGWAVVRLFGLERGFPLVSMLAFTPYVAAAVVIPVGVAAALRRWSALVAALAVAITFAALLLPRAFSNGDAPASGGAPLTVMTANLHFGEADPVPVVELVREHHVDVLCVQELTPALASDLRRAGLTRELQHSTTSAAPTAFGSGVYSRHALTAIGTPLRRPGGFFMPSARIGVPAFGSIEVTAVHPPPPTSAGTVRDWRSDLRGMPPTGGSEMRILAGDFNATLDHDELRDVLGRGYRDAADAAGAGLVPTWSAAGRIPLFAAKLTIDHVLADERIAVRGVAVNELPGSDHRAVIAELVLPATGPPVEGTRAAVE